MDPNNWAYVVVYFQDGPVINWPNLGYALLAVLVVGVGVGHLIAALEAKWERWMRDAERD